MGFLREVPPTAGFAFRIRDLGGLFTGEAPSHGALENDFKQYLGVEYAGITCSGTAGIFYIAQTLKRLSGRTTVIIPEYICPSVPLAIVRAGLKVQPCDTARNDFNFDLARLDEICGRNSDIAGIVVAHLGGIPADFEPVAAISRKRNILIIEDCAQSLGARYRGKKIGTLGDFSFFSLARGKGLTIYEGGVVTAQRAEYCDVLKNTIQTLEKNDLPAEVLKIAELIGYCLFYRPYLFWFVYRFPELFWRWKGDTLKALSEYFSIDFPLQRVSSCRRLFGHLNFRRLQKEFERQSEKAGEYIRLLKGLPGITILSAPQDCTTTYPFMTLILDDQTRRNRLLGVLEKSGLGVSQLYTRPVSDYSYLKKLLLPSDCPNARSLAARQIILSTSAFLRTNEINTIASIIRGK